MIHRADRPHRQIVHSEAGWVSHDQRDRRFQRAGRGAAVVIMERPGSVKRRRQHRHLNQREATVAWNRDGRAAVRRREAASAPAPADCASNELAAREAWPSWCATTGLVLSPYYPAGKMACGSSRTFHAAAGARRRRRLCLGTIDAWVVWTLTGGAEFRCDWSNASRTQLFDLRRGCWSEPVCEAFGVDPAYLPQVTDSDGLFGMTNLGGFLPAPVPVHGVLGDSHAALFAQGCHSRGMAKATYGTGSSVMMNVGDEFVASSHGGFRLARMAYGRRDRVRASRQRELHAGASRTWLRDDLGSINNPESHRPVLRRQSGEPRLLYCRRLPASARHTASDAEGCVFCMTRTTGRAEFVKAADESIAYQIFDVIDAMVEIWRSAG